MRLRVTCMAAVAVILTSLSIYPVIHGVVWFWASAAAVAVVAGAAILTRLSPLPAALGGGAVAALACYPLLAGPGWYLTAGGGAIVAVTVASLTRLAIFRIPGCLITYLASLLVYLNLAFASSRSLAGVVPTGRSVSYLWVLAGQGMSERAYSAPVPEWAGAVLLAAAGIGLIAVITDLIAVRLRSPAIAGLALFTLYCVPITTSAKRAGVGSVVVFCIALVGYLALLAADGRDRFRIWGRLVTVWQAREDEPSLTPDTRALAASGRRIGLAAACVAIVIPLLIPGLHVHSIFSGRGGDGPGHGPGTFPSLPNPLVQMRSQLRDLTPQTILTYHTTAPEPPDQYLQVYVLNYDRTNGRWDLVSPAANVQVGGGPLHGVPGLTSGTRTVTTTTKVKLSTGVHGYGSKLSFLPLPYAPERLSVTGIWLEDDQTLMVYSARTGLGGLSYTVASREAEPTGTQLDQPAQIPADIARAYLGFPVSRGWESLPRLADKITRHASTPYRKALALQSWFLAAGRFSYDVDAHYPNSTAGLIQFLTKYRRGYCQQFAFAMATLARLVGIPSRIAVGYTAGYDEGNGKWAVTSTDAHAWPELYFPGAGWLRFEPTPGGSAGGQGTATTPGYAVTPGSSLTGPPPIAGSRTPGGGGGRPLGHLRKLGLETGGSPGLPAVGHASSSAPVGLIVLVLIGLAAVAPRLARSLIRRRRWLAADGSTARAHAAWREFRDDLADYGISCRPSESPRAICRRVTTLLGLGGQPRAALDRLATAEERARYAPQEQSGSGGPSGSGGLRTDVAAVRRAISGEAGTWSRIKAVLVPPSALRPARTAIQRATEASGWLDSAWPALRKRHRTGGDHDPQVWAGRGL